MTPAGVYDLLEPSASHDVDQLMRSSWTGKACKDLVVFAINLKPLPATAEHCTGVLSENKKSCMRVPFYVLGVTKPSSGFGWSKVPFKGSQVVTDKEPLYTEDSDGVRVWSFEKLSNPMHKGNRARLRKASRKTSRASCASTWRSTAAHLDMKVVLERKLSKAL